MSSKEGKLGGSGARTFSLGTLAGIGMLSLLVGVVIGVSVGGGGRGGVNPVSPSPRLNAGIPQPLGETVTTPVGNRITVTSFESNVDLPTAPPKNKVFARAEAEWCADASQAATPVDNLVPLFVLEMSDGSRVASESRPYTTHDLANTTSGRVSPGGCVKGWVVFAVPIGETPDYVDFNGVVTFRWEIPAASPSP